LLTADAAEPFRVLTLAREETVERARRVVAGLVGVKKQDAAAAASENQRSAQPGRAGADDDDIEFHGRAGSKNDAASA
jgi:hypothetical protein